MKIRKAKAEDLPFLVDFNYAMAEETEGKILNRETLSKGVSSVLLDEKKGFYVVACNDNDTPVGSLLITFEWSDWRNAYFWWIQSVYVKPEFRQKGVFSRLYKHIIDLARQDGHVYGLRLYVHRLNEKAQKVYRNLGMSPTNYELFEIEFM